uniref:RNA polymerase II C-terminal domain phosphatase-like n=1 Tax=Chenopodium quinoa TaxID=63459 RepID=A0A803LLB5_CHEQI
GIDMSAFVGRIKQCKVAEEPSSCAHPGFFKDMCIECGKLVGDGYGDSIPFRYIHKDLRLGSREISRLRNAEAGNVLRQKKLFLVLDLDQTLLHTANIDSLSPEEAYLMNQTCSFKDTSKGSLFQFDKRPMITKLRPFVREFLQEASKMFEMYIYTMGEPAYGREMAKLLDPRNLYFDSKVISRADCTNRNQKGLDMVLGFESAVLILDDTESVWERHKDNLILMERYHFFSYTCRQLGNNCKSLAELKLDENESDGALAAILRVLKSIHYKFFDPEHGDDYASRDVRELLRIIRKEVLKDCKIVFSLVLKKKTQAADQPLWRMAEQLGATCSTELDSSVTHVVSKDATAEKSRRAVEEGKFLVNPRWIEAANFLWKRQSEDQFPVVASTAA